MMLTNASVLVFGVSQLARKLRVLSGLPPDPDGCSHRIGLQMFNLRPRHEGPRARLDNGPPLLFRLQAQS